MFDQLYGKLIQLLYNSRSPDTIRKRTLINDVYKKHNFFNHPSIPVQLRPNLQTIHLVSKSKTRCPVRYFWTSPNELVNTLNCCNRWNKFYVDSKKLLFQLTLLDLVDRILQSNFFWMWPTKFFKFNFEAVCRHSHRERVERVCCLHGGCLIKRRSNPTSKQIYMRRFIIIADSVLYYFSFEVTDHPVI